ncbi:b5daaf57-3c47-494b-a94e-28294091caf1 [Thermothielavioides terrestris]|uniref:B5daaf57-3c47-494b-a94e-28294091caf1 n=1 Tax=Thermothielavioides terrestris TaxID=2587410 RepID=A0A3S4D0I4_9PEZI|nr:b5daaf57-3c47-494b-a94e-28294091caf1 [Thermothielavioides terrestris]
MPNKDNPSPTPDEEIHATLTTISLSQNLPYNALSYTWGSANGPAHHIQLNGRPFSVRSNLHDCLVHLRRQGFASRESGVPLWIDALCINQDDVAERNSQLRLMGDIYRRAASVVSWLGSDDQLADGARAVARIAREWARLREEQEQEEVAATPGGLADGLADEQQQQPIPPRARLEAWLRETEHIWLEHNAQLSGLVALFQAEYWRRIWITQELLLADPATHVYVCGGVSFTEAELDQLSECILNVFSGKMVEAVDAGVWTNITLGVRGELAMRAKLSAVQLGLVQPSLMFVLDIAGTRAATEPRDVVYGLLHLIKDHGIEPDYNKPVWEVYADWAVKTMRAEGNLELLAYVTSKEEHRTSVELDLPSWIPDIYNFKGYRAVDWMRRGGTQHRAEQQGRDSGPPLELLIDGRMLKVDAVRCGTVKKVTLLRRFSESKLEWQWDMVRFCMDYVTAQRLSGKRYPTGIPPLQALVRLVMQEQIAALTPDEYPTRVHEVACDFVAWLIFSFNKMFSGGAPTGEPLETAASLLGLSWGEDFPETYEEAVFPGVNVRELMGWNRLEDALKLSNPRESLTIW